MRNVSPKNRSRFYLLLIAGCAARPVLAAPAWYTAGTGGFNPNIPDFYQHQNWTNAAANGWESSPGRSGWCYYTAFADVFYDLTEQGYSGLLSSDVTQAGKWFNDMYNPGDIPNSELAELANDPNMNNVQDYLDDAGHSSTDTNPLLYNQFDVNDNGSITTATRSYLNLLTFIKVKAQAGDEVVLKLGPGTVPLAAEDAAGRWWTNFHCVAFSGINVPSSTVFVADPDTNKGSALANAGWPSLATFPGALASAPGDPIPIPGAPMAGTAASYNTFYAGFTFNKNTVNSTDSPQYNGTIVTNVDTISAPKGKLVSAAPSGGSEETSLAINSGDDTVDKIFLEPTSDVVSLSGNPALFSFSSIGSTWADSESNTDPLGNALTDGGIEFDLSGGTGLEPGEIATADLGTMGDFSATGYTLLLHFADDAADEWDAEVSDQPFDISDPTGLQLTIPEPSIACIALPIMGLIRRRREK